MKLVDALEEQVIEDAMEKHLVETNLHRADTSALVKELYERRVPYVTIFGMYYELEESISGRLMTVEDALIAGVKEAEEF